MEAAAEAGTGGGAGGGRDGTATKKAAACDVAALRKCLEENKGDRSKCQDHIDAFRSSCSTNPPPPPPHSFCVYYPRYE
uniref:CHCH domain-containing protein n=1 Tax=Oryza punctata TaxID=4537 RepID=A0A0E0LHQ0_ORYPU